MLTIYGSDTFNAGKVVLTAEELNIKYNYVRLDLRAGEQKSPEHLRRHPLGKVPAIEHDGHALFESNVICRYLARVNNSPLYPDTPLAQAQVDEWVDMMAQHVGRWLSTFFFQEYLKVNFFKDTPDQNALKEARGFLDAQLPALEKQLGANRFLAGNNFTIADIIAFCYFTTHEKTSVELKDYPKLNKWYADIKQRPTVTRTQQKVAML